MPPLLLSKLNAAYHAILNRMRPAGGAPQVASGYVARGTVLEVYAYFYAFDPIRRPVCAPCSVGYHVTNIAARRLLAAI